jgi:hypothetical protein
MIRQLIREILLSEIVELSPRTDLYHRTTANLQPGDVVEGKRSSKHREKSQAERALEIARIERFSDKPSRIGSTFASLVPRSRFAGFGQLYRVALIPGDPYLVADSMLIDKLWDIESTAVNNAYSIGRNHDINTINNLVLYDVERAGKNIIDNFWKGVTATKENLADIEVMAPRFRVLEKVEEGQAVVRSGDTIKLGVEIWVTTGGAPGSWLLSKMKDSGMEISPYGGSFKLPIGTVLKIRSATPGKRDAGKKPWSQISFDNPWQDGEQTYGSILHLSDESSKSLSRSIRSGVTKKL